MSTNSHDHFNQVNGEFTWLVCWQGTGVTEASVSQRAHYVHVVASLIFEVLNSTQKLDPTEGSKIIAF